MKTITNQETIKPSSPTPPHLNRYNLSFIDYKVPNMHMAAVFLFKNYNKGDMNKLKNSLSKSLTQYYPFAGRLLSPYASHIECNDEGVGFLEASMDVPLRDLVIKRDPDETIINKLVPNVGMESDRMLEVQVTHFSCGGVAVAVSTSHKLIDGVTMANFVNHWATVTRGGLPINPTFVSAPVRDVIKVLPPKDHVIKVLPSKDRCTSKRFVFSNSKLGDLKNKINNTSGMTPLNPSRVESLASLLFKCAVNAATTKAGGSFQPSNLSLAVNMREKLSSTTVSLRYAVGNIINLAIARMADSSEIELNQVISSLRKDRLEIEGAVTDVEELGNMFFERRTALRQEKSHRTYSCTSLCNSPIYKVDFGWGNPVRVIIPTARVNRDSRYFIFMDAASGDGIEVNVILDEEEMTLLQNDKEFLAFVQD